MDTLLVRGYVNYPDGHQDSCYFEKTVEAMASFLFQNAAADRQILIDNILGKTVIRADGMRPLTGRRSEYEKVQKHLDALRAGEAEGVEIIYHDLQDTNGVDEFESQEQEARAFIKLFER